MEHINLYETENLAKNYQMGEVIVHALREVSVEIQTGEFIVILGPSGSGKSTLLNILGGMDSPSSGVVRFRGKDISGYSERERTIYRRRHVGYVFQFFNLVPTLTARENIELAAEISEENHDPIEALDAMGLTDRADHFPSQLSGGEQQRVAIARAIVKEPDVLFCDEPTGALDSETGKFVLEALSKVHKERGATVIVVTHNAPIGRMAERVFKMHNGTIFDIAENESPVKAEELSW